MLNNPVLTLQLGILGELLGRIVNGCVREVSLAQVSCILMYVYVALPTPVGAWSMALGLRQRFEYYYYQWPLCSNVITLPYVSCSHPPLRRLTMVLRVYKRVQQLLLILYKFCCVVKLQYKSLGGFHFLIIHNQFVLWRAECYIATLSLNVLVSAEMLLLQRE